jgi:hypothetical protein
MAGVKETVGWSEAGLSIFNSLWEWTGTSETWRVVVILVILSVLLLWGLGSCLTALGKVLETGAKLIDAIKSSSLPRFMKRESRIKVRRRSQFCGVLEADLTNIAKAESWNDQYFTDLEAEVEMEGGYYISALHRLFGRVSTGLRKEKSLIRAISSSSERAIQLTGEPGSGKSVALRHLASQLAAKAKTNKGEKALVPLYINLREMAIPKGDQVTADIIRDFILENIRRGDSDTSAYVRENWADYRERGIWFFLFDSFDEIPEILHAEKGNPATKEYAEAIRKFLEGMGECRGILASREFKGPESLPWKKFRILRLTSNKQQELVENAFLSQSQERAVLRHLASNESSLANTPLFLTLLCRYVKEFSKAPQNDYELLSLQIDRLAQRDPEFLRKTYGITSSQLLSGAQRIARLFAEESTIGLAPTVDQVEAVLAHSEIPGGDIQRFVAAMVDAKIARSDVANAAPGDRRFAFAHRRYQEALFVRHLVAQPGYLSGYELLTDPRWREYAVTLLETQPKDALSEMFAAAIDLLDQATASQSRQPALVPLQGVCGYFNWKSEATAMLSLLQEGLVRRVGVVPAQLALKAERFLAIRWSTGDSFDRMQVMKVASLLPQETLAQYLEETFATGSEKSQNEAFNQTVSLIGPVPLGVRRAVLGRLANEILGAKDSSALLRVEALVARLPATLGAAYVQRRCLLLWRLTRLISSTAPIAGPFGIFASIHVVLAPLGEARSAATLRTRLALIFGLLIVMNVPILAFMALVGAGGGRELLSRLNALLWAGPSELTLILRNSAWLEQAAVGCTLAVILIYATFPVLYRFRAAGQPLSVGFFFERLRKRKAIFEIGAYVAMTTIILAVFGAVVYILGLGVSWLMNSIWKLGSTVPPVVMGILAVTVLSMVSAAVLAIILLRSRRLTRGEFLARLATSPSAHMRILLSARNWAQFEEWLPFWYASTAKGASMESVYAYLRSLSAALQHTQRGESIPIDVARFMQKRLDLSVLSACIDKLEDISANLEGKANFFDVRGNREFSS